MKIAVFCLVLIALFGAGRALDNGLALTPPMGWIHWERYTCNVDCDTYPDQCINENLFKTMAKKFISEGYKDVGYEFINIDDCWAEKVRDPVTKRQIPDRKRFPNGIKALADWIHARGLKLGIYGDAGYQTCDGYPASKGQNGSDYWEIDAQTFAEWEVDSLKFDGCYNDPKNFDEDYPSMQRALNKTGHPIVYSCEWPLYQFNQHIDPNYDAISRTCNLYRNHDDVQDSWDSISSIIDFYGQHQDQFRKYNGPGMWLDPDMLVLGNYGLSYDQQKAQMAFWCLWSSPLYMSNDLRDVKPEIKAILQNKHLIAVDQDPLGIMGTRLEQSYNEDGVAANFEVWVKPMTPVKNGFHSFAVIYFNRYAIGQGRYFSRQIQHLVGTQGPENSHVTYDVYDLFDDGKKIGNFKLNDTLRMMVNASGAVAMVKLVPVFP